MRFLRLNRTEWAGLAVLVAALVYGSQWLTARDLVITARASIEKRMEAQERKLDALFNWADLISQIQGWPRPTIPDRPAALPHIPPSGEDPIAAEVDQGEPSR